MVQVVVCVLLVGEGGSGRNEVAGCSAALLVMPDPVAEGPVAEGIVGGRWGGDEAKLKNVRLLLNDEASSDDDGRVARGAFCEL